MGGCCRVKGNYRQHQRKLTKYGGFNIIMATANFLYQDDFRLMAGEFSFPVYAVDEDGEEINGDPIDYETDEYSLRLAQEKIDEIKEIRARIKL